MNAFATAVFENKLNHISKNKRQRYCVGHHGRISHEGALRYQIFVFIPYGISISSMYMNFFHNSSLRLLALGFSPVYGPHHVTVRLSLLEEANTISAEQIFMLNLLIFWKP
jgi:hypothetical protein